MQYGFAAAKNDTLIENINRELAKAVLNKEPVILLEYEGYGHTLYKITRNLKNYHNKFVFIKDGDDGSCEILDGMFNEGINDNRIRVCGVCNKWCVKSTVLGLSTLSPD